MRTSLVAGASGLVGGYLLRQLLDAPEYGRVIALVRQPLELAHPKLVTVTVDFADLEKNGVDLRCDDAFCCLGSTIKAARSTSSGRAGSRAAFRAVDHAAVLAFAWWAQRSGVGRFFVVSSLGANAQSRVFYNRVKGETEEALAVLNFRTLAIFRPSLLLGPRRQSRLGERIGAAVLWVAEPLMLGGLRKYRAIKAEVVARAMVRCSYGRPGQGVLIFPSDEIQDLGEYGP